jgi:hypothetical protein
MSQMIGSDDALSYMEECAMQPSMDQVAEVTPRPCTQTQGYGALPSLAANATAPRPCTQSHRYNGQLLQKTTLLL